MANTVIFIDGEYVKKTFDNAAYRVDVPKVVSKILQLARTEKDNLLRVYYYTSPPYQSSNPSPEEKKRYRAFQKFEAFLKTQDSFEIRLGRTERRGEEMNIINTCGRKPTDALLSTINL